ncbi:MAG: hypothetical protein P8X63_08020 [Desulfuromonadaceae bacterium]
MFFIPLSQIESVELVIHALRVAGGQADCTSCPAHRVCMKQCLTIAEAIGNMAQDGTLPFFEPVAEGEADAVETATTDEKIGDKPTRGGLKLVK